MTVNVMTLVYGHGSVPVPGPNFEPAGVFTLERNWSGTLKVGSELELRKVGSSL